MCTAVDTYSGCLVVIPFSKASQTNTIKTLEIINLYYNGSFSFWPIKRILTKFL